MQTNETIDSIIQRARALFPDSTFSQDVEKNLRALLQSQLKKLDMVSREEFEAQVEVLRRSREKIDALERQLAELVDRQSH